MTAPILARSDVPGVPPTCTACGQPMPWHPPLCTCGHPVSAHHQTGGGNLTYCGTYDHGKPCDCGRYEHAQDGHYGPRTVT